MCIGRHNMTYSYTLLHFKLTVTTQGKDLEVIVNSSMKTSVKWTEAVSKANKTLGCTREILYYHLYYGNASGHRQLPDSFLLCQAPCEQRAKRHLRASEGNSLRVWPNTRSTRDVPSPSSLQQRRVWDCSHVGVSWARGCTDRPGAVCSSPKCTYIFQSFVRMCAY